MDSNETIWLFSAIMLCVVAWSKARTGKQRIGAWAVSGLAATQVIFILLDFKTLAYVAAVAGILIGLLLLEAYRRWELKRQNDLKLCSTNAKINEVSIKNSNP